MEATNKTIFLIIKKKLDECKGAWAEKLLEALWACRTMERTLTGDTPFGLAFGCEVVIPVEIGPASFRVQNYDPKRNDEGLMLSLDQLEERRDAAEMTVTAYEQRISRYINNWVRPRRLGTEEGHHRDQRPNEGETSTEMERTVSGSREPSLRCVPPRDCRREKATPTLER